MNNDRSDGEASVECSMKGVIQAKGLTKSYGRTDVVSNLSFHVRPGVVTGFLGPNGAGKSTVMRMLLGLAAPSRGIITIDGLPMRQIDTPSQRVGALLDAGAVHPRRSAYDHLLAFARVANVNQTRVHEVLAMVGLSDAGRRLLGTFSLGMNQRLGVATALLGDPQFLVLDEPLNGLDPDGIRWMRSLMLALADRGRTVLFSSHLMSEMQSTAHDLVIISQGRLIVEDSLKNIMRKHSPKAVLVRTAAKLRLTTVLGAAGLKFHHAGIDALIVHDVEPDAVGRIASLHDIALKELTQSNRSLEDIFIDMTRHVPVHAGIYT